MRNSHSAEIPVDAYEDEFKTEWHMLNDEDRCQKKDPSIQETIMELSAERAQMEREQLIFNWLATTTHPGIATASSMLAGWNKVPVNASVAARKHVMRWLKGTLGQYLMAPAGNKIGFRFTVDSDWAGLHSVSGESRSRIGIAIFYNGMRLR